MNERIKDLYGRAMSTDEYGYKFDPEKFAELIVKEYASLCENSGYQFGVIFSKMGKAHFGVE